MAEDDRPGDDPNDYHYFGPFGPPSEQRDATGAGDGPDHTPPLGIGRWSYGDEDLTTELPPLQSSPVEETRVLPTQPGSYPSFSAPSGSSGSSGQGPSYAQGQPSRWGESMYPAPSGVPPLGGQPPARGAAPSFPPPRRDRKPLRALPLILLTALLAVLIGGAAGYGGSRLAARTDAVPQTSSGPTTAPSPSTTPSAPTTPFSPAPGEANTVGVAKAVLPSTVMIQVGSGTTGGTGSGFILDTQGHIMTNNHVVAAAEGGRVRVVYADGTKTTAEVVGRSPSYDLAVIKVDPSSRVQPIRIGDSDTSQIGESVIAIGAPLGLPGTVTAGIVSAKNRPVVVTGSENADSPSAYINAIQTDAPINPGNSGGPLVDSQARVIGVNSAILTLGQTQGQSGSIGLGFAIPINQAMEIGRLLIKNGKATYPVIGATVASEGADEGVKITTVDAAGPAAAAGLRADDVVTAIDGKPVTESQELIVTIRTHRPGEKVRLQYERGGATADAVVTLGSKEG